MYADTKRKFTLLSIPRRSISLSPIAFTNCGEAAISSAVSFTIAILIARGNFSCKLKKKCVRRYTIWKFLCWRTSFFPHELSHRAHCSSSRDRNGTVCRHIGVCDACSCVNRERYRGPRPAGRGAGRVDAPGPLVAVYWIGWMGIY